MSTGTGVGANTFRTRRVRVGGVNDMWSSDLVDMQSFSKYSDRIKYLLNIMDMFSELAWFIPLGDKTGTNIFRAFNTILKGNPVGCG